MKYLVTYTETYTGSREIEANSKEEAMRIAEMMIESEDIDPTDDYDGHDITVDYAEEL